MPKSSNPLTSLDGHCCIAALEGNAISVAALLQRGANLEAMSRQNLLRMIAEKGHCDVASILLEAGADINAYYPSDLKVMIYPR